MFSRAPNQWNKTVIYTIPCLNTFRPRFLPHVYILQHLSHLSSHCWGLKRDKIFIDFSTQKLLRHEKLFQQLQRTVSSPPEVDCGKKEAAKGRKVPFRILQKGFPSYNVVSFHNCKKSYFLFVFHPSFISINCDMKKFFGSLSEPI